MVVGSVYLLESIILGWNFSYHANFIQLGIPSSNQPLGGTKYHQPQISVNDQV